MRPLERDVKESVAAIARLLPSKARVGAILGSGLGAFAGSLDVLRTLPYAQIPHFPVSTTSGHAGVLCHGRIHGTEVLVMQGRIHYYEGYPLERVTYPVRVLAALGVRCLVVTNASGAVNARFAAGDLVVLRDQINLMGASPLVGLAQGEFPRDRVDLADAYDPKMAAAALETGLRLGLPMRRGVAGATTGPSYETPAEIRMLRAMGADAVSMSTIPEVIVARSLGVRVLGISCITNLASGVGASPLTHDEVLETSRRVAGDFTRLLRSVLPDLDG
jgi:purine-nucleoside phosphorylase